VGDRELGDELLFQLSSELIDLDEGVGYFGMVRVCCLLEDGASRCRSIMVVGALADGEEFDFLRCAPPRCFTILERAVRGPAACTPQVHLPRDQGSRRVDEFILTKCDGGPGCSLAPSILYCVLPLCRTADRTIDVVILGELHTGSYGLSGVT